MTPLWGIDLGGTKIEGVVVDASNLVAPLARVRVPTEQEGGYAHIISQISKVIELLIKDAGTTPSSIGFSTPGAIDPVTQTMKNSNTQCLNGKPLHKDLKIALKVPCILANDANCFALAESTYGAAKGATSVFGIILGTGVGGGLVFNNSVIHGRHGIAGEWGHNVLNPTGPSCYCGKRGCVETIISGPALEHFYQSRSTRRLSLAEIASLAEQGGDSDADATIQHLKESFGRALAVVMNIFDPEIVVLGGGVSNIEALYRNIHLHILPHLFNPSCTTPVVKNVLGDSAGVFGAAALNGIIHQDA